MKDQKSNLELILDFGRDLLDYLKKHRCQGGIIAVGISGSMLIWSMALNIDNLIKLKSLF